MVIKKLYQNHIIENSDFILEYGVANKEMQQVVCLMGKIYLSCSDKNECYDDIINNIMKFFKRELGIEIRKSAFSNNFIFDYDFFKNIREPFKNKILTFEVYIKQEKDNIKNIIDIKNDIDVLLKHPLEKLKTNFAHNNISLSKVKS